MSRRTLLAVLAATGLSLAVAVPAWAGDYTPPVADEPGCVEVGGDDPLLELCLELDLDDEAEPAGTDDDDLLGELLFG